MVEATIRMVDNNLPVTTVWASHGKVARAEPVSALYEQGKVHHIGTFPQLEDQMCAFTTDFDRARAGYSPDRLDALVWGLTELLVECRSGAFSSTRASAQRRSGARPHHRLSPSTRSAASNGTASNSRPGESDDHVVAGAVQNCGAVMAEQFRCGVSLNPLRAWFFPRKVSPIANATGPAISCVLEQRGGRCPPDT